MRQCAAVTGGKWTGGKRQFSETVPYSNNHIPPFIAKYKPLNPALEMTTGLHQDTVVKLTNTVQALLSKKWWHFYIALFGVNVKCHESGETTGAAPPLERDCVNFGLIFEALNVILFDTCRFIVLPSCRVPTLHDSEVSGLDRADTALDCANKRFSPHFDLQWFIYTRDF